MEGTQVFIQQPDGSFGDSEGILLNSFGFLANPSWTTQNANGTVGFDVPNPADPQNGELSAAPNATPITVTSDMVAGTPAGNTAIPIRSASCGSIDNGTQRLAVGATGRPAPSCAAALRLANAAALNGPEYAANGWYCTPGGFDAASSGDFDCLDNAGDGPEAVTASVAGGSASTLVSVITDQLLTANAASYVTPGLCTLTSQAADIALTGPGASLFCSVASHLTFGATSWSLSSAPSDLAATDPTCALSGPSTDGPSAGDTITVKGLAGRTATALCALLSNTGAYSSEHGATSTTDTSSAAPSATTTEASTTTSAPTTTLACGHVSVAGQTLAITALSPAVLCSDALATAQQFRNDLKTMPSLSSTGDVLGAARWDCKTAGSDNLFTCSEPDGNFGTQSFSAHPSSDSPPGVVYCLGQFENGFWTNVHVVGTSCSQALSVTRAFVSQEETTGMLSADVDGFACSSSSQDTSPGTNELSGSNEVCLQTGGTAKVFFTGHS
jgi:hypothetical protein